MLTLDGPRIFELTLNKGRPNHRGYGDCDDITVAGAALLASIGADIQICTTAKPGSPFIFDHVFFRFRFPGFKQWVTFDPVLFNFRKNAKMGEITKFGRMAIWDLNANLLHTVGSFPPKFRDIQALYGTGPASTAENLGQTTTQLGVNEMYGTTNRMPNFYDFEDHSMGFLGADDIAPDDPRELARACAHKLADFQQHGILGYGCYADVMGQTSGEQVPYIMAEYDEDDTMGNTGLVMTKAFEMTPDDYAYSVANGCPAMGALALADDGTVYEWAPNPDGMGGFFKKLFKKVGSGIRKVAKKVKGKVKKLFMKTKIGRAIWKVGGKVYNFAKKIVKPLIKKLGPIAKKIAPIAALIPGVGPAIAGGLMIAGKVADIMKKYDMVIDKMGRPQPKSKAEAKAFAKDLAKAGRKMGKGRAEKILDDYRRKKGLKPKSAPQKRRKPAPRKSPQMSKMRAMLKKQKAMMNRQAKQLKRLMAMQKQANPQMPVPAAPVINVRIPRNRYQPAQAATPAPGGFPVKHAGYMRGYIPSPTTRAYMQGANEPRIVYSDCGWL